MRSPSPSGARAVSSSIAVPRILLLFSVLALTVIGCVMIYSASIAEAVEAASLAEADSPVNVDASALSYLTDQLVFVVLGVIAAALLWKVIPLRVWQGPFLWVIWGLAVVLLVLTAAIGTEDLGAQRWVNLGPVSLQPSEFAKIAFALMAARIFHDYREGSLSALAMVAQAFVLIGIPVLFLFVSQSDLGTTVIIAVGILAVMWMGEAPLKLIGGICVLGLIFVIAATAFTGYRSDRMLFLNPWNDGEEGLGKGFQLIHSYYAFSQGGLFGVGLGNSSEKYYLPEAETDFIFAIIGEELGMVGALVVVALFVLLLYAGMRVADSASDGFGGMVAGSCTLMLVFQAFLNIGCVVGLLPTTGKPLPFVSSGGSSLIATFIMVGLILAVSQDAGRPSIYERRRADLRVVRAADSAQSGRDGGFDRRR